MVRMRTKRHHREEQADSLKNAKEDTNSPGVIPECFYRESSMNTTPESGSRPE
jgi:hypothetical protein